MWEFPSNFCVSFILPRILKVTVHAVKSLPSDNLLCDSVLCLKLRLGVPCIERSCHISEELITATDRSDTVSSWYCLGRSLPVWQVGHSWPVTYSYQPDDRLACWALVSVTDAVIRDLVSVIEPGTVKYRGRRGIYTVPMNLLLSLISSDRLCSRHCWL